MARYKKRIFSGNILEQLVYNSREGCASSPEEREERFKDEEARNKQNKKAAIRRLTRLLNTNFNYGGYYMTCTFAEERTPKSYKEARAAGKNYIRRIRRRYPDAKIVMIAGKNHSKRDAKKYHLHMVVSPDVPEEVLMELWLDGMILTNEAGHIPELREHNFYDGVDHGRDYRSLAIYLIDHWMPEFGGKRWYQTRNMEKPEEEEPKKAARYYDKEHPPRAPQGYRYVGFEDNGKYGFQRYTFAYIPEPYTRDKNVQKK